jgi:hypothetical protein
MLNCGEERSDGWKWEERKGYGEVVGAQKGVTADTGVSGEIPERKDEGKSHARSHDR